MHVYSLEENGALQKNSVREEIQRSAFVQRRPGSPGRGDQLVAAKSSSNEAAAVSETAVTVTEAAVTSLEAAETMSSQSADNADPDTQGGSGVFAKEGPGDREDESDLPNSAGGLVDSAVAARLYFKKCCPPHSVLHLGRNPHREMQSWAQLPLSVVR